MIINNKGHGRPFIFLAFEKSTSTNALSVVVNTLQVNTFAMFKAFYAQLT